MSPDEEFGAKQSASEKSKLTKHLEALTQQDRESLYNKGEGRLVYLS